MVVQVSFLKCDVLSQFRDRYSKVLLSQLMTSSFKGNKLYSLPFRSTEQKARLRGKRSVFFFYNKPTGNHRPLTDASQVVLSGKSKFTTQLYNLFLFSLPHLDLWTRKEVSSSEIEWNGHFREKSLQKKCLEKKVQSGNETINGHYLQASISGASAMPSCLSTDIFLGSWPNGQHFISVNQWFDLNTGWTEF